MMRPTIVLFWLAGLLAGQVSLAGDAGSAAGTAVIGRWLPLDKDGWTILKPSTDSRILYVSSSAGNDAAGKPYAPDDAAVGSDPFHPSGAIKPFKTIAAAMKNGKAADR